MDRSGYSWEVYPPESNFFGDVSIIARAAGEKGSQLTTTWTVPCTLVHQMTWDFLAVEANRMSLLLDDATSFRQALASFEQPALA